MLIETCQWPNYRHVVVKILAHLLACLLACLLGFPIDLEHDVQFGRRQSQNVVLQQSSFVVFDLGKAVVASKNVFTQTRVAVQQQ